MKKEALRVEGWMDGVARAAGQMTTCKLGETRSGDKYTQFASKQQSSTIRLSRTQ